MKTHRNPTTVSYCRNLATLLRLGSFLILVALIIVPLFLSSSASSDKSLARSGRESSRSSKHRERNGLLPFSPALAETIATFAADCATPKTSFILGETVCAQTDGVDLNFPGGRWVNWIRPDLSIAHGGSGVTDITTNPQTFTFAPDVTGTWKVTIAETGDPSQTPAVFTVGAPPPLATYEPDCITPKTLFNLGDTVCAKSFGVDPAFNRRFAWVDPAGLVRTFTPITTDPQTDSFMLPSTTTSVVDIFVVDNRGKWNVKVVNAKGTAVLVVPFQVQAATASADLSISKSLIGEPPDSGQSVTFSVAITNFGPNAATNVDVTDDTPANASFVSVQSSDPNFTCTGSTTVTCTAASLAVGASVTFDFVYAASGASGSSITNIASVESATAEINNLDNSASSGVVPIGGGGGTPPTCTLECPSNIIVTANTNQGGQDGANVTFAAPDAFGDCGTVTSNPASGSFFPVGTTVVTSTSATGGGSCTFTVRVVDIAAPTITCPLPDITADAGAGGTEANVTVNPPSATGTNVTVTGVRSDAQLDENGVNVPGLNDPYPVGTTIITWNATEHIDGEPGRSATCTQRVIVTAPDAPTITCPPHRSFTVEGCNVGKTLTAADIGTPTTTGNGITVEAERSDGLHLTNDPYPVGTTVITWTATDSIGRVVSCSQNITVTNSSDTTPPTITAPPNVSVTTNACGQIVGETELGTPEASDDCGFVNVARTGVPPGNFFPTGTTIVTYTATDGAGNTATATQTVTVTESPAINPTITAPADVTLFTGPGATSCGVTVTNLDATLGTATASDNCPGVVVTRSGVPAGNVFPVGQTTVTYTATDRSGNTASDDQVVTVVDNTPPAISCPANITLEPTCPSGAIANWTVPVGTDNCPGAVTTRTAGPAPGSVFPIGTTTVTYSVTDAHGNGPVSCSFTVTVKTVVQTIDDLKAAVNANQQLSGPQRNGLIAKLDAARQHFLNGNQNGACAKLSDFVNSVQNFINHGNISAATGNAWISTANNLRNTIGCTSLPCS